jgi:hypothetical protein
MYVDLHVKCLLVVSDFNQNQNVSTYFSKNPKFHENLSGGSRNVPREEKDGRTDRQKASSRYFFWGRD